MLEQWKAGDEVRIRCVRQTLTPLGGARLLKRGPSWHYGTICSIDGHTAAVQFNNPAELRIVKLADLQPAEWGDGDQPEAPGVGFIP